MRKIGTRRILLCLLLHLLMGAIFLTISSMLLNSVFRIRYIDEDRNYEASRYTDDDVFEESVLFTEIYTKQLQDIIEFTAVRSVLEKDGTTDGVTVDITSYIAQNEYSTLKSKKIEYYADDLIKWGRQGFTYSRVTYTLTEFLDAFDSDIPFDIIKANISDGITYTTNADGISQVSVMILNPISSTIDGIFSLNDLVENWIEYFLLRDALQNVCLRYTDYYEIYKSGLNLYNSYPINIHYVIRKNGNGKNTYTYTNCDDLPFDFNKLSDDALNDIFADFSNYIVYYPDRLEYITFSGVEESDLFSFARLYSQELSDGMRLWAFVGNDYSLANDAFALSKNEIESRADEVGKFNKLLLIMSIVWIILFIYLAISAGSRKKGESYTLFWDSIWIEIYLAILVVAIIIGRFLFVFARGGYYSSLMAYGDMFYYIIFIAMGIAVSIFAAMFLFSFIRRIKAKSLANNSILAAIYRIFKNLQDTIEGSDNVIVSAVLPFSLFIGLNIFLIYTAVMANEAQHYFSLAVAVAMLVVCDMYVVYRQYRKARDQKSILSGIKKISSGELDYKLDKGDMLSLNEDFAEAVNNIGNNIKEAVSTSMKDEKMKSDLITNVSHDLKTPLTSIINYVDLLKNENITAKPAADYIVTLEEKAVKLKQLLEDLIEASRLSSGNIEVNFASIGIAELLRQVVGEYSDRFDEQKLTVIFDGETDAHISADGRLMWRIMDNLFGNIIKYALKGTRVYVSFIEDDTSIGVSIKNISASPNMIQGKELTEKFIRGDSSRSTEGSGLGLFIAKSLTEVQNGVFEVVADGDLFKVNMIFKK